MELLSHSSSSRLRMTTTKTLMMWRIVLVALVPTTSLVCGAASASTATTSSIATRGYLVRTVHGTTRTTRTPAVALRAVGVETTSQNHHNCHQRPRRIQLLPQVVSGDASDIFEAPNSTNQEDGDDSSLSSSSSSSSSSGDDVNSTSIPCILPDFYGDYGVETPYTDAVLVAWTFQIQGLLEMTVSQVQEKIIPVLEKLLSAHLVPRLFNNTVCPTGNDNTSDNESGVSSLVSATTEEGGGGLRRRSTRQQRRRHLLELTPWVLDNGAEVTGLLMEPKDTIMSGHDGILCENREYIENSRRCFKLIGGLTLTGRMGDIDQAVQITQEAIRFIMNDSNLLDRAVHASLLNIQYVAPEPDYHMYFGEPAGGVASVAQPVDPTELVSGEDSSTTTAAADTGPRVLTIWPFLAIGGGLVLAVSAAFVAWQGKQGSFGQIRAKQRYVRDSGGRYNRRSFLALSPSSDHSEISSKSSDGGDHNLDRGDQPHFHIISNTWQSFGVPSNEEPENYDDDNAERGKNMTATRTKDRPTKISTECSSSCDDGTTAHCSSSNASSISHFYDEGRWDFEPTVMVSGSSIEDPAEALLGSGSDKESYDTSLFTSSGHASSTISSSGHKPGLSDDDNDCDDNDTATNNKHIVVTVNSDDDGSADTSDSPLPLVPPRRLRRSVL